MQVDIAKLVGAASAPVALIIAASIFLSNLGAKYGLIAGIFRQVSDEYRKNDDAGSIRSESLFQQVQSLSGRLRLLRIATLWLTISILCFLGTVICTSISVLMPKTIWTIVTAIFSFAGMLVFGAAVVIEMIENHRAKEAMILETAEFKDVLEKDLEDRKKKFRLGVKHDRLQPSSDV